MSFGGDADEAECAKMLHACRDASRKHILQACEASLKRQVEVEILELAKSENLGVRV